jgi:hypothetical protein
MENLKMSEILEAVKLRLRFDNTGEFERALLQLLQGKHDE